MPNARASAVATIGETPDAAEQRMLPVIYKALPLLNDYIPR